MQQSLDYFLVLSMSASKLLFREMVVGSENGVFHCVLPQGFPLWVVKGVHMKLKGTLWLTQHVAATMDALQVTAC